MDRFLPPIAAAVNSSLGRALARVTGSDLRLGNEVRLLQDAQENYPAWLAVIRGAERAIHFENFIVADDATGRAFAEALAERAAAGIRVRVLYDWLGSSGRASPRYWDELRQAGADVRVFNPPRLSSPFWIHRNHRKLITVDGRIGFVSGLCVADSWKGKGRAEPWRDTGISLAGPIVGDLDATFAATWAAAGDPLPPGELLEPEQIAATGDVAARVVSGRPGLFRIYRLDQLIAATARRRIWLTDAYSIATSSYVQALAEAAHDGVDVRLLVPGVSDVPVLQPIVRAGYRPLIAHGIRVFEWNGSMLHAKTAVVDGQWSRVGSTNLNLASWATNWELDVVVEDARFGEAMEAMFLRDLENATEIVPTRSTKRARTTFPRQGRKRRRSTPRDMGRFAAGAIALSHTIGSTVAGSRSLNATEARSVATIGFMLLAVAALVTLFPVFVIAPLAITLIWFGLALVSRAVRLWARIRRARRATRRRNRVAAAE
jgi:cardiolipin synthase A/B